MIVGLLFPLFTLAQSPVVTRSNFFDIGDTALVYYKFDTSLLSISPGPSGANVTWDFSDVDFNHPSVIVDTLLFLLPDSTPFYPTNMSADYSLANIAMMRNTEQFAPSDDDYHYYYVDNDSLSYLGHWADGGGNEIWEDHLDNPMNELRFPLQFGDAYVDSFERFFFDMSGSDAHFITGTISVTADAHGTMITPDGTTLNGVVRVYTETVSRDSNGFFGITDYTSRKYSWWSESKKGFVLTFYMAVWDSTAVETAEYQKQTNVVTSVEENRLGGNKLNLYPNPSNGLVELNADAGFIESIELHNALGQRVRTIHTSGKRSVAVNVNGLVEGMYFVKVTLSDNSTFVQKLVVKP